MQFINQALDRGRDILQTLTSPRFFVPDEEERQDCYTFSLIALASLVVCIPILLHIALSNLYEWQMVITTAVVAMLALTYALSRSRFYKLGRVLLNALPFVVFLSSTYVYRTPSMLLIALLPLFTAVVYHRICYTVINGMISLALLLYAMQWFPQSSEVAATVLILTVVGFAIVLQTSIRRNLEKRLRAQKTKLTQEETRLRAAIDGSRQIFVLLAPVRGGQGDITDFRLVEANAQAAGKLNLSEGMLLSSWTTDALAESYRVDLMTRFRLAAEFNQTVVFEQELPDLRWYEYQIAPLEGDLIAVSANNVTDRKLMEWHRLELEAEKQRGKALQKLLTNVTHDLNTPLTVIKSNTSMARKLADNPDQTIKLQRIDQQTDRLSHMIGDLIEMSRLEQLTEADLARSEVELGTVLESIVTTFRHKNDKHQQLHLSGSEALPPVLLDLHRVEVALWNILDNAVVFTPEQGTIEVACLFDAEQAIIEVRDSGPGIPAKDMPYIFEAFYRGDEHRPANGGAGLGLAIAQRIIEAHGGRLEAENRPGGGALFRISFPLPELEPA